MESLQKCSLRSALGHKLEIWHPWVQNPTDAPVSNTSFSTSKHYRYGCGTTNSLGERKVQFFNDLIDSYYSYLKGFHKNEILIKIDAHSFNAIT